MSRLMDTRSAARVSALSALVVSLVAGCNAILGIDDHPLAPDAGGPTSDAAAPDVQATPDAPSPPADAGPDGAPACAPGEASCSGNTVQTCVDGQWKPGVACSGATPICSNGVCGTFRTAGGLRSTAPTTPAADGGVQLRAGGFELGARTCDARGLCVRGGVVP